MLASDSWFTEHASLYKDTSELGSPSKVSWLCSHLSRAFRATDGSRHLNNADPEQVMSCWPQVSPIEQALEQTLLLAQLPPDSRIKSLQTLFSLCG
jgi:hypothetical protein